MHDVLIALQTDLASSIAIRFISQIEQFAQSNIQTVHVPDLNKDGHPPAAGWVYKIWEDESLGKARDDISKLIHEENAVQLNLPTPKVLLGERDQAILEELRHHDYDILVEGLLHSFEPDTFFKRLDSDLYRNSPCPIFMVKNLVKLDRGIQVVGTPDTIALLMPWFYKFWKDQPLKVDVLVCQFEELDQEMTTLDNDTGLAAEIESGGLSGGTASYEIKTAKGSPTKLAALVRDHALILSLLPESSGNMARMLAMSPCPVLFCPENNIHYV